MENSSTNAPAVSCDRMPLGNLRDCQTPNIQSLILDDEIEGAIIWRSITRA